MANETSSAPPKKHRFLRVLLWSAGALIILIVAVYFVATSSAFLKGVILPRVSKELNAEVSVSDASIHPFKEVVLENVKVQAAGLEPVLTAQKVVLHYSLMDIIRGNIHVDEVTVSSPTVALVEKADGSRNIDPILKAQQQQQKPKEPGKPKPPEQPSKPSKPPQIDVRKVAMTGATVRYVKEHKGGTRDADEISNLNVTLENLKNGQSGKLTIAADMSVESNPPAPATNGTLQAKLDGHFEFALTPDLKPSSVQGNTRVNVAKATGAFSDAATLAVNLDCDATPTEIKQVALKFAKGEAGLAQLLVSGPFDMEKQEGKLTVQLAGLDKRLLNLIGAKNGLDFGPTTIGSTNQIELAKAGAVITAAGQLNVNQFQVTRTNQTTPALDLVTKYNVTVDRNASNAVLRELTINGTQKGNSLIHGELANPMTVAWGNTANAMGDSALNLTVTNFNLLDWKPFIGDQVSSGEVAAQLQVLSQQAGKQVSVNLDSRVQNLAGKAGTNEISGVLVTLQLKARAADLKQFNLTGCEVAVAQRDQNLATVTVAGTYDAESQNADMQVNLRAALPNLLKVVPQPDASFSSGTFEAVLRIVQRPESGSTAANSKTPPPVVQSITGKAGLSELTGHFNKIEFRGFGTTMDLDINKTPQTLEIRKVAGEVTEGGKPGGNFEISGTYGADQKANITAKLNGFNQVALRPFLEPALADKKLVSIAINANANAQYNPQGDSAVKADLQVTNLVVNDPKGQIPPKPLEAKVQLDTALQKQVVDIKQAGLTLTPTQRGKNELKLTGRVDMTKTNAYEGNLKLAAESLDFTTYYDLFAGGPKGEEKKPATPSSKPTTPSTPAPASPPAAPEKEPEPMNLPLRNFTADVNIGQLYLREIAITNLQTVVKIDGGHVVVNPCQLAINNAPVKLNADLDLGVPGYKYDTSLNLDSVPLAPFVNSFQPERKGQLGGTLSVQASVKGQGTTGASLQKHLSGKFDVLTTNMNLHVIDVKSKMLKSIINVVAGIPELIHDPAAGIGNVLSSITGGGGGGLTEELKQSPIDSVTVHGSMGSGLVDLKQALVQSAKFEAEARGTIKLAPVLTNSAIDIPVTISLSRPIAQKLNLLAADTPANVMYGKLPDFFAMKGTIGAPKEDIKKSVLAGIALKSVSSVPGSGSVGGLLNNVGGLFGGGAKASKTNAPAAMDTNTPAAPATNAPAQNQNPVNNLLNDLFKPKKK
jgi:hypothetical protein